MRIVLESNAWCRPSEKQAKQSRDMLQMSVVLRECVSDEQQRRARLWNVGACQVTSKQKTSLEIRPKP